MCPSRSRRAFSVTEMMIGLFLFGILSLISWFMLQEAVNVWRRSSSRDAVARSLSKSWGALRRDLECARQTASTFATAQVPASLTGKDGDALIMLTPVDPATGNLMSKSDGSPFMMRNILYYLVVPQNHSILFKQNCAGGADTNGYEMTCPHKVLIRCQEDSPHPPANPSVPNSENKLLPAWTSYLTRPSSLGVLNGDKRKIVANNLLTFRVTPDPVRKLLTIQLSAVAIEEATRKIAVGTVKLGVTPYTVSQQTAFVTRN